MLSCSFRWFINAKLRTKLLLLVIPTMLLLLCVTLTLSFLVFNQYEAMVYGSTEQILNMAAGVIPLFIPGLCIRMRGIQGMKPEKGREQKIHSGTEG